MTLPQNSLIISKIKRTPEKLNFHQLFIFNKSGICIYKLNITDLFQIDDEQLISSYFTALMSFTKELIGNKIKTIEMGGDIKLVVLEKHNLYYTIICKSIENKALIKLLISNIHKIFQNFVKKNNIQTDLEFISDNSLDEIIIDVINDTLSNEYDMGKENKIIHLLKDLNHNDEINGVIFLTDLGHVLYSTLKGVNLRKFLKEVEFRVKICNNAILKLFYTSKEKDLIYSEYVQDKYFVILIFDSKTRFGIAEFLLQKIVNKINSILSMK
jgi:hypothetical protein